MTSLTDLPPELLVQIIEAYFLIKGSPLPLMLVNSAFYIPARRLLHSRLRFTSNAQLAGKGISAFDESLTAWYVSSISVA